MKFIQAFLLFVDGLLVISALPQYNQPPPPAASQAPPPPPLPASPPSQSYGQSSGQGSSASFGPDAFAASQPSAAAAGSSSPSASSSASSAAGSSGGNLNVDCTRQDVGGGKYKFTCAGANKDALSLRSEHILWLDGPSSQQQVVDIEIPNYKIEELIKAGFKVTPGQGSLINLLLKKPEQSYDAQVDTLKGDAGTPSVKLQYEPVEKKVVHFPNDKPYSPLTGPILPPAQGGNSQVGAPPPPPTPNQVYNPYSGQQQSVQRLLRY